MRLPPIVVNRRHEDFDIYIGHGSKWGNPYRAEDVGRARAIELYEQWLRSRPDLMAALPSLAGKLLGCWCHPLPCHGDVLVRLFKEATDG